MLGDMQAGNAIAASIAKSLMPLRRQGSQDKTLSHLQRRNSREFKNTVLKRQLCCGMEIAGKVEI